MRASRRDRFAIAVLLAGALITAPRASRADDAPAVPWYQALTVNGFVSASYGVNLERPRYFGNQFRVFDFDQRSFNLDVAELVVQKAATRPRETGFRIDADLGGSVPRVADNAPVALRQAFTTWIAPVGSGLRFDAGKFITPFGYEVIEGCDNWNDEATRSLLFGFAIPFTHTGVRAGYTFSPRVSALLLLVNGWDVVRDNNHTPSGGAQITITPAPPVSVVFTGMIGPEYARDDGDKRTLGEVVATWKVTSALSLGVNGDLARERAPSYFFFPPFIVTSEARWRGAAAYARFAPSGPWALSLRGESFDDKDGSRTGAPQSINEITVTPEVRLSSAMVLRADLRMDHSTIAAFETHGGFRNRQRTILVNALYHF